MFQPVVVLVVGFAVLTLSREVVASIAVVGAVVLSGFALTRAVARRVRGNRRMRSEGLARVLGDFLETSRPVRDLRRAIEDSDEATYWGVIESLGVRLAPAQRRRLARAMRGNRHAAAERAALRDDSPWRRELAARRLGVLPSPAGCRALHEALEHGPEPVAYAAALGLASARDSRALEWVLAHPEAFARRLPQARTTLLRAFGRSAWPLLTLALDRSGLDRGLERAIVETLGLARHEPALGEIAERLRHADPELRVAAARALGRMARPQCAPPLIAALRDDAWPVRAQAAWALGRMRAPTALMPLAAGLTDRSWWVRRHSAYALRRLGAPGRDALRSVLDGSPDPYARDMAREALEGGLRPPA